MKESILCSLLLISVAKCSAQDPQASRPVYCKDFGWTIMIPEGHALLGGHFHEREANAVNALTGTTSLHVAEEKTRLFEFGKGDFNYLEASYEAFRPGEDGDYIAECKNNRQVFFETIRTQMPGARVDSSSFVENISGLVFQAFRVAVVFPNGTRWHALVYSRLFGTRDLSINIAYTDEAEGERMCRAWLASTFE